MKYVVEIYVRIVIAVFGFIAPSVTLLMPIFSNRISMLKKRIEEEREMINNIQTTYSLEYTKSLGSITDVTLHQQLNLTIQNHAANLTKPFQINLKKLEADAKKLNLKKQIIYIFGSLIASLVLVMLSSLINPDFIYKEFDSYEIVSCILLIFSSLFFAFTIKRLWTSICIVVDHNSENDTNIRDIETNNSIGSNSIKKEIEK